MTRTSCLSAVSFAAIVVALTAYGCGSSSTISPGTGGTTGTPGSGGSTTAGLGGFTGGTGAGGATVGVGGSTGTAGATGTVDAGPGRDAGPARDGAPPPTDAGPAVDGGPAVCTAGAVCAAGFTCRTPCVVVGGGGVTGTRACTCGANGRLNCPGGNATCLPGDAGMVPPPPVDAGPAACRIAIASGVTPCVAGVADCTRNRGGVAQTCACGAAVDGGVDAGTVWTCM